MLNNTNAGWPVKPLSEVVDLNPRLDKSGYRDDLEVSFVPMAAVEAGSGRMEVSQTKHFSTVKKGSSVGSADNATAKRWNFPLSSALTVFHGSRGWSVTVESPAR